jgi:hypothetical protein
MESFQSEHQVLDISMQSQQLLEQMQSLDKEKVALETQNKYYHYLRDYIRGGDNMELETVIAPFGNGHPGPAAEQPDSAAERTDHPEVEPDFHPQGLTASQPFSAECPDRVSEQFTQGERQQHHFAVGHGP